MWRVGHLLTTGWQPETDKEVLDHVLHWESSCWSWVTGMWTQAERERQKGSGTPQEMALLANYQNLETLRTNYGKTVVAGCIDDETLASDEDSRKGLAALQRARDGAPNATQSPSHNAVIELINMHDDEGGLGLPEYILATGHEGGRVDITHTSQTYFEEDFLGWAAVLSQYLERMESSAHGRRIFATEKGRLGLCPAEIEPGDMVVVVLGASVPFVLRQHEDHHNRIVGSLYVDGFMNGEGLQDNDHLVRGSVIG